MDCVPTGYKREDVNVAEWHCHFSKTAHVLDHYLDHALCKSSKPLFVDVGCGLSGMGVELLQSRTNGGIHDGRLLLLDISPDLVESLQQLYAADPAISCLQGDCRDMKSLDNGCAAVVIDKGTLDALCGEDDKIAMLKVSAAVPPSPLLPSASSTPPPPPTGVSSHPRPRRPPHQHLLRQSGPPRLPPPRRAAARTPVAPAHCDGPASLARVATKGRRDRETERQRDREKNR
jgi:hypothetical protein